MNWRKSGGKGSLNVFRCEYLLLCGNGPHLRQSLQEWNSSSPNPFSRSHNSSSPVVDHAKRLCWASNINAKLTSGTEVSFNHGRGFAVPVKERVKVDL